MSADVCLPFLLSYLALPGTNNTVFVNGSEVIDMYGFKDGMVSVLHKSGSGFNFQLHVQNGNQSRMFFFHAFTFKARKHWSSSRLVANWFCAGQSHAELLYFKQILCMHAMEHIRSLPVQFCFMFIIN